MKNWNQAITRFIGGLFSVLVVMASAPSAYAKSANAETKTTLVSALSLVKDADLNFGDLIAGTTAGTAIVSPTGVRQVNGGTTAAGGTVSAARFWGSGTGGQRIKIRKPVGPYLLARTGGGTPMTMRDMTMEVNNATELNRGNSGQYRIDGTGPFVIRIGGTLDVNANQQPGTYTGTFEVEVNYF